MTGLKIAKDFELPEEAVTHTFALLAIRRAGKSNAACVMCEEMYDAGLHFVVIDPKGDYWGIRSSADGKKPGLEIPILGARSSVRRKYKPDPDLPLEPTAGAFIADLIVDERVSCVVDVSDFDTDADKVRFLLAFATRLFKRNEDPLHLILEEADDYIPQNLRGREDHAKLVNIFGKIVKQGGNRGLGCTIASQRSAVVNKDVLTQVETLIPMRNLSSQDRKAISDWVDFKGMGSSEIVGTLPTLKDGEAWIWSPSWLQTVERIRFRRRRTFDSGATPKVKGKRVRPVVRMADLDIPALEAKMLESIERSKAEDPKELQKELAAVRKAQADERRAHERDIAALRKQLDEQMHEPVEVKVPVLPDGLDEALSSFFDQAVGEALPSLEHALKRIEEGIEGMRFNLDGGRKLFDEAKEMAASPLAERFDRVVYEHTAKHNLATGELEVTERGQRPPKVMDGPVPPEAQIELTEYARHLFSVFGERHPMVLTQAQLAVLAGRSRRSSAFPKALRELLSKGLVIKEHGGDTYALSQEGRAQVGYVEPKSTEEIREQWRRSLPPYERTFFDVIVDGGAWTEELLAEETGRSVTSSAFPKALRTLKRLGLIEPTVDGWVLVSDLM